MSCVNILLVYMVTCYLAITFSRINQH
uniref:Uncharacterized protein n=1 Tax=Rhizophora mucronata TaxID=61149 RepID=A0A2P2PGS8_RHIMU